MIKLTKVKQRTGYQRLVDYDYFYKDWTIESVGGYISIRHFWVHNVILNIHFWRFKLKEVKETIEKIENDFTEYTKMDKLFKTALY